jgi:hypothetical protein
MPAPLIPWQAIIEELQKQNFQIVQTWLVGRAFTNGGAALVHGRENHESTPLSLEEKQTQAVLFLIAIGKWPKPVTER